MKKIAIIIRGPAGSGKSTIAKNLRNKLKNYIHLDIDKFKHIISKDSSNMRTRIAQNVGIFFINQLIKEKLNIIVEEIFRIEYYIEVRNLFLKNNYKVISIFLKSPLNKLIERDKSRKIKTKGRQIITNLHKEIKPFKQDFIIDSSKRSKEEILKIILKQIK